MRASGRFPHPPALLPWRHFLASFVALVGFALFAASAQACPFCSAPQLTLAEQIAQSDAAVIGEWQSGVAPDFDAGTPGSTTYRIEKIIKSSAAELAVDQTITVKEYFPGEQKQFALLIGNQDLGVSRLIETFQSLVSRQVPAAMAVELNWLSPLDISPQGFEYVANAPGPENDPKERLRYYVKYLEASDPLVADDAYAEFANAPYETIVAVKDAFPREKVRNWVFSETTPVTRLGLYGLMIGLCGTAEDQELLREKVVRNDEDFRLGIDGVMAGYLLLSGDAGLTALEDAKLKPSLQTPSPVPFSETFATLQAIKFMWEYGQPTISPERLQASMRILLKHPDLADLVIIDLARWEDWTLLDDVKVMYGAEPYDVPAIKRAIVGYLIACTKQKPEDPAAEVPAFVSEAEAFLAELEETDPKTVKTARLLFR
ncbi:hypothetical protein [Rubinisphaera margarita]|uniref:hypothetical protein n=1 Tax=Rubinisphaera margarita TaxID=2909586 RepID=UPI001EE9125A|nr:hypothetical protein [Rubinisphaera margarita]MCG6156201.1 hypothetical protein [Rubinisphaera margarita]